MKNWKQKAFKASLCMCAVENIDQMFEKTIIWSTGFEKQVSNTVTSDTLDIVKK